MVYLTRREHFNAAHRLYVESWSPERNEEVFGRCANRNYHGHNFEVFVTVCGEPDPVTGFLINVKELGAIIKREIVRRFDHKNLNLDVTEFHGIQPTIEHFVRIIWELMEPHLSGCALHRVQLWETETIYAEYYGPKGAPGPSK